jgi:hypothetical protein
VRDAADAIVHYKENRRNTDVILRRACLV